MSGTKSFHARCLCGTIDLEVSVPITCLPLPAYVCNCTSCRRLTGHLCLTFVFPIPRWAPAKDLLQAVTRYEFSEKVSQYHCTICGTIIFAEAVNLQNGKWEFGLSTGTFAEIRGILDFKTYEFVLDTLDGGFTDFMPSVDGTRLERWSGHKGESKKLPINEHAIASDDVKLVSSDRLHAQCKCGGVNFWISRLNTSSRTHANSQVPSLSRDKAKKALPRFPVEGDKFPAMVCSCDSCRLDSGNEWAQWAFVPAANISLDHDGNVPFTGSPFGTLRMFRSSEHAMRSHCGVCGASVLWHDPSCNQVVRVAVGLLSASEGARAETWLHWNTSSLIHRGDAIRRDKSLVLSLEAGLKTYGQRQAAELA